MLKKIVLAGLVSFSSAHIKLRAPVPFELPDPAHSLDPLLPDGTDFPCKNARYDAPTQGNEFAQGSDQTLKFIGSAVHGGGSCQVSITTDLKPSKNSVWKVIKSIEGGCPAKNLSTNILPLNPNLETPFEYSYTIPKDLAAGKYTLAWTWFNKIGNREMYMNCAPISVTGSGGSKDALGTLPDMFVANTGNGCGTLGNTDLKFPNPGKDLDQFGQQTPAALTAATGNCAAASGPQPTGGAQPTGAPQPTSSAGVAPPADPNGTIPGGVFITKSQGQQAGQPSVTSQPQASQSDDTCDEEVSQPAVTSQAQASQPAITSQVQTSQPAVTSQAQASQSSVTCEEEASQPAVTSQAQASQPDVTNQVPVPTTAGGAPPATNGTVGGDAGAFAAGTACSTEGMWNCIGGNSFQRCGGGQWSATQGVAAGTKCSPGQSPELKMDAVQGNKRSFRRRMRSFA
ncbi:endoglucanase [Metarhizium brunneum]